MAIDTSAALVDALRQCGLLSADQLTDLTRNLLPRFPDPKALAGQLIQSGWLTPYQVNQIFQGQGNALVLGQYRILERLGEGGMGQVFKARHHSLGRIVALKVIRKDRLQNTSAVQRFQREMLAAGQLSHPNVVNAFDADAVKGTHFVAMELVEGIDLTRLVRDKGPLPSHHACDCIRQAALGLQHAHEKGMVHRDIKPSNLLVSKAPGSPSGIVIKILDMGLARFEAAELQESMTLSQDGTVLGTPDFMAPEQAKNSSKVDGRADIYSLGCTFYYLLAGKPPFSGETSLETLLQHQMDAAPPIGQKRPDVPEGVRLILEQMLAKRPEDRVQTAGAVAAALVPYCKPATKAHNKVGSPRPDTKVSRHDVATPSGGPTLAEYQGQGGRTSVRFSRWAGKQRWLMRAGASAILVFVGAVVALLLLNRSGGVRQENQNAALPTRPVKPLTPTTDAPRPSLTPALIVQCGKGLGEAQDQKKTPGYDCKLVQGVTYDGWANAKFAHCWYHETDLIFEITVPKGTGGLLKLWFVDGDDQGRKQTLFVQGKRFGGLYENFGPGVQVAVPITPADTQQGKIEVKLVSQSSFNAVVSVIEFIPGAALANKDPSTQQEPATPVPTELVAAWTKAGARVGWMVYENRDGWLLFREGVGGKKGEVPAFMFSRCTDGVVGKLPQPQHSFGLSLDGTDVTNAGLKELASLKGLQALDLGHTIVSDAGLKELAGLKGLQALNLRKTDVTDAGLKDLADLKGLQALYLDNIQVTDAGMKELAGLKGLQALYLGWAQVTDTGMKELAGLTDLQALNLHDTKVTDVGLKELAGLKGLQSLNLRNMQITDEGLKGLAGLKSLQALDLGGTKVTDAGLKELAGLKSLQSLNLHSTQVTDAGLKELAEPKGLKALYLRSTGVTGAGVAELQKALPTLRIER